MGIVLCLVLSLAPVRALPDLRVGMEVRHAPWAYLPGTEMALHDIAVSPRLSSSEIRRLEGFDVDVMHALAKRLSRRPRIVPTAWGRLEHDLVAGRFDVIVSAWTPTPETPKAIVASAPYQEWGLMVVVRKEDSRLQAVADLDGAIVGHYRDPAVEKPLQALGHGTFQVADSSAALFRQLKAGTVDAVIFDSLYVSWLVSRDPSLRVIGPPLNRLGYHVGIRKADPALSRIQAEAAALAASPEMAAIRRKWGEGAVAQARR